VWISITDETGLKNIWFTENKFVDLRKNCEYFSDFSLKTHNNGDDKPTFFLGVMSRDFLNIILTSFAL
jgi:hypothetical protein